MLSFLSFNYSMNSKSRLSTRTSLRNTLRIIGGQWRSQQLPVSNIEGLRPTPDRLRETLFNWLMHDIEDAHCLDVFAGSGSLGIEALSRSAKEVIFLEKSAVASQTIRDNLQKLRCSSGTVVNTDALAWLERMPANPFDIIFLDPPFRKDLLAPTCQLLIKYQWIKPSAHVYIEAEKTLQIELPKTWKLYKEKTTNQVKAQLYLL